ncbi:MAG: DUF4912 domain-containing protein [Candidatus Nitrohelix vancouverensis]|uniref:DUF4912 domain-containing protein n=1 Tax=Candidatus Nitrohelix vancouverensis TaxID=2705534 RepID=A0A7T0BZS6_9BACT|nr:MAG: DUF4912 domain-containing protein [Candidatus Nitrohelix vancouverensis]
MSVINLEAMNKEELLKMGRLLKISMNPEDEKQKLVSLLKKSIAQKPARPRPKEADKPFKNKRARKRKPRGDSARAHQGSKGNVSPDSAARPAQTKPANPASRHRKTSGAKVQKSNHSPLVKDSPVESKTPELPDGYGDHKITALPISDTRIFCFWELQEASVQQAQKEMNLDWEQLQWTLRAQAHEGEEKRFNIFPEARKWYLDLEPAGRTWKIDIGLAGPQGQFKTISSAQAVPLIPTTPSSSRDMEWEKSDRAFWELFQASTGSKLTEQEIRSGKNPQPGSSYMDNPSSSSSPADRSKAPTHS